MKCVMQCKHQFLSRCSDPLQPQWQHWQQLYATARLTLAACPHTTEFTAQDRSPCWSIDDRLVFTDLLS